MRCRRRRSGGPCRGQWKKMLRRRMLRWMWGRHPPLEIQRLNGCWCCWQLCWQWLVFGRVVKMTRWLGWVSSRGPGVRCPPDRWSSWPQPIWMKSWIAGSKWKNRWQRKPAKEEMWPPWRWLWRLLGLQTRGQLEGLGVHAGQVQPEATRPSCPPAATVVELPVVVA